LVLLNGDQIQLPHNYGDQKAFGCHMQMATKNILLPCERGDRKLFGCHKNLISAIGW
jgi:hypothetical protein